MLYCDAFALCRCLRLFRVRDPEAKRVLFRIPSLALEMVHQYAFIRALTLVFGAGGGASNMIEKQHDAALMISLKSVP